MQISAEATQDLKPLRSGVHYLLFGLEYFPSVLLGQNSNGFSYPPARSAEHLQAIERRNEERYAMVTYYAHAPGKQVEGLELKAGEINALKLLGGIGHERLLATSFPPGSGSQHSLHLVPAQIFVVQSFQILAQFLAGDPVRDIGRLLGIFQDIVFDENGTIHAESQSQRI